jgi:hypothetical protein
MQIKSFVLAALLSTGAAAELQISPSILPLSRCNLQEVIPTLKYETTQRLGELAKQSLPLIAEQRKLVDMVKIPGLPLIDQLTKAQVARFSELTTREKSLNVASLVEDKRARDLDVLMRMAMVADQDFRWQSTPDEKHADFPVWGALVVLRTTMPDIEITAAEGNVCSLDFALHAIETEGIAKMEKFASGSVVRAVEEVNGIARRNKQTQLDTDKLPAADRLRANELINNIIKPFRRIWQFATDLERIRLMARASLLIYTTSRSEVGLSGGDIDAIGSTIRDRVERKEISESTALAVSLWYRLNKAIPAQMVADFQTFERIQNDANKPQGKADK